MLLGLRGRFCGSCKRSTAPLGPMEEIMWNFQTDTRTENERYLEEHLEQERQWRQKEEDRRRQERERQRTERKQMYEDSLRSADNWRESLFWLTN